MAYGHAQVYSYPDITYLEWRYENDENADEIIELKNDLNIKMLFISLEITIECEDSDDTSHLQPFLTQLKSELVSLVRAGAFSALGGVSLLNMDSFNSFG